MQTDGRIRALIAHVTIIGWLVAVVMNVSDRKDFATFYIRQFLGIQLLLILGNVLGWFPLFGGIAKWICVIAAIVLWILSIMGAYNGKREPSPFIGHFFQKWFAGL